MPDWERQLLDLASLRDTGVLSPEEFVAEKKKIVAQRERMKIAKTSHGVQSQLTVFDTGRSTNELSKLKTQSPAKQEVAEKKTDKLGISAEIPKKRVKLRRRKKRPSKKEMVAKNKAESPSDVASAAKKKIRKRRKKKARKDENEVSSKLPRSQSSKTSKKRRRRLKVADEGGGAKKKVRRKRPSTDEPPKRVKRRRKVPNKSKNDSEIKAVRKTKKKRRRVTPSAKPVDIEKNVQQPPVEQQNNLILEKSPETNPSTEPSENKVSIPSDYALQLQWQKEVREIYIKSQLPLPKAPYNAETVSKYRAQYKWVVLRKRMFYVALVGVFATPILWQLYLYFLASEIEQRAEKVGWNVSLSFPYSKSYISEYSEKVSLVESMRDEVINSLKQHPKLYSYYDMTIGTKIPKGSFMMGDSAGGDSEKPTHEVEISSDFIIMSTEVTLEFFNYIQKSYPPFPKENTCVPNCPAEKTSWYDAVEFANALSVKMGLPKCYEIKDHKKAGTEEVLLKYVAWPEKTQCLGWRLPTEAEWEYAAKGGSDGDYSGGSSADEVGWSRENSNSLPHAVKTKKPNGYGLYDMSGNVWEWCWDSFDSAIYTYRSALDEPIVDPTGEEGNNTFGDHRVRRGGNFNSSNDKLLVYRRDDSPAGSVSRGVGFRLVRTIGDN